MKNVYGAVRGALVKGGLSAAGGGISGGFGNVIMEGNWSAFGNGFGNGALVGGVLGGISGGREGFLNAKNSVFERNLIFGGLTASGKEAALGHFTVKYELYQSGAYNVNIDDTGNSYGTTKAISPESGRKIGVSTAVDRYPNGVNSEYTLSYRKMSLRKIEANVIHEKRHVLDLYKGNGRKIWNQSGQNYKAFEAMMEIRAHTSVLEHGFQKSYNLGRIKYWNEQLKILGF